MEWYSMLGLLVAFFAILVVNSGKNNVCKTFDDYYSNRDNNKNCYYNQDYLLTVPQIITRYGYAVETHHTTTKDGYILTMFRISHGQATHNKTSKPVFLQHGITLNSAVFVNIGRNSLAFTLADAGYDVWLGNFRGNIYSRSHNSLVDTTGEYWNFSWHEHGVYDVPAQIDFIHKMTKQKIYYVGYSMGSTAAYIYSSTYPKIAKEKIKMFIGMAPVAFLDNIGFFEFFSPLWYLIEIILYPITNGRLFLWPIMPELMAKYICFPFPFQMKACQIIDMLAFGFNYVHMDPETLPITLKQNPDSTSLKAITHFVQVIHTGNFQYYDYGREENMRRYGNTKPPHYDLSKIEVPYYLIAGSNDKLGNLQSIKKLHNLLPKEANPYDIYVVPDEHFTHISFISAINAADVVYKHIANVIDNN